jgi:Peptidase family M23
VQSRLRRVLSALALVLLVGAPAAHAYPWPLRPFDRAHPVRGNFGDPRTVFAHGVLDPQGLQGEGRFSFHNGVDISAPSGTPAYPVMSGRALEVSTEMIVVRSAGGHVFQYVHLDPVVVNGQKVIAGKTVLGFVKASAGHVHLTELLHGRVQNPLARGHLMPYTDRSRPRVSHVIFDSPDGYPEDPTEVHGDVDVAAVAYDLPSVPVPGSWHGYPVAPALVEWWLTGPTGRLLVPVTVTADFRRTLPANRDFWVVYARGTYQNKPRFGNVQYATTPGRYEYRLTRSSLDTRRLRDGAYTIHVRAVDIRGNVGGRTQAFNVCNDPTVCYGATGG